MPVHDELGKRMKTNYEEIPKIKLYRRIPVAIRVDGRSFHSFAKGLKKPFDNILIESMQETMEYLCKNVQNVVLGYQQSDEISLLLIDYKKLESQAFFDYEVQKICSITASMATLAFNRAFTHQMAKLYIHDDYCIHDDYYESLLKAYKKGAMFDSRCFNIPVEEVTNYFYWRESDAIRNSIQMVGQANFSHKELQNKSCANIKDMLLEKGIDWDDLPTYQQRGSCCIKTSEEVGGVIRSKWIIDNDIPIFVNEGRDYVEKLLI